MPLCTLANTLRPRATRKQTYEKLVTQRESPARGTRHHHAPDVAVPSPGHSFVDVPAAEQRTYGPRSSSRSGPNSCSSRVQNPSPHVPAPPGVFSHPWCLPGGTAHTARATLVRRGSVRHLRVLTRSFRYAREDSADTAGSEWPSHRSRPHRRQWPLGMPVVAERSAPRSVADNDSPAIAPSHRASVSADT